MTDYGRALRFGAFLTPDANEPAQLLGLAATAEDAGLDLLTFQDHPYQPRFLDTWTLLSYLAARTERIRLAPNVANLPLRPPAVLARSAAALDVLTDGRVELGLGSGYFFDAIEAMGGPVRSAGEHVDALDEAITLMRRLWQPGPPVHFEGTHYRLAGIEPGPLPAHPIELWVGAYQPRMLALTGRRADAWVPTLAYAPPDRVGAMTAILDDAARDAGRDPAEVRRIYNIAGTFNQRDTGLLQGPPARWIEQLAELALQLGFDTFVLGPGDDAERDLRRFAEEVAPGVVETVAASRRTRTAEPEPAPRAASVIGGQPTAGHAEAAGDGAATAVGQASQQTLLAVHQHLREELERLQGVVAEVAEGVTSAEAARGHLNQMTMRQNYWTLGAFCASYCRVVAIHHAIEDSAMFPELRAADASLGPVLDRLGQQHETIADLLEQVDDALVATVDDDRRLGEAQTAVAKLGDALLDHLAEEEAALLEPIGRLSIRL